MQSMFELVTIEDRLRIAPEDLELEIPQAVTRVIERLYFDRVIVNIGLVVTLYDILTLEGGFVQHTEGSVHYDARFRLVVFKPLPNEVLLGKLHSCDK